MWFSHPFSFSQAPNGKNLRFTVKSSGDFTSKINQIKNGSKVLIDGPLGRFVPNASAHKYLFIAGGIGITPIRAQMESLSQEKKDMTLLYSFKNAEDNIFMEELKNFPAKKYFFVSNQAAAAKDNMLQGKINEQTIPKLVPDYLSREAFVCGPPEMIKSLRSILLKLGLSKRQIHYELFSY